MRRFASVRLPAVLRSRPDDWLAAGLAAAAFLLYLGTLAPTVVTIFDDSLEFQLVTYLAGIAHPTGYPLYTMLGKLFTLLPVGDVAYRVNLMSAVFAAAAVGLVYRLAVEAARPRRGLSHLDGWPRRAGGITAAALFAVGPVFWSQATIAEVYSLHSLFVALLLRQSLTLRREQDLYRLAFLAGLSLTHHRTAVLVFPALALPLLTAHRRRLARPAVWGKMAAAGFLPLLLYLYLPLRGHIGSLDGTYENTWAGFWRHVSGGGYGVFIFGNPFNQTRGPEFYLHLMSDQFYTLVPGLIGLLYLLWFGRRAAAGVTGLAFAAFTAFNLLYRVADIEVFFIPNFLLWAVWSGAGAAFLLGTAAVLPRPSWRPAAAGVLVGLFGFIILQLGLHGAAALRQKYTWQVHDTGLDMLAQPRPGEPAAIVGILGEMTLLRYFQATEQVRPDILTVPADREADRLAAVSRLLAGGKAVYLTRDLPGAAARWSLAAAGPLIRVLPAPQTVPPDTAFPGGPVVGPGIRLAGWDWSRPVHSGPGPAPLRLRLVWQVQNPVAEALKVSARLVDINGQTVAAVDAGPVHFAYPTPAWRPGEFVTDGYDLPLPANLPAGAYTPRLIWYNPAENAAEVGRIDLPAVTLP